MKQKYYFILSILLFISPLKLVAQDIKADIQECALNAGNDAIYLKDFVVKLDGAKPNQPPPVYRITFALRKGIIYRLNVCKLEDSMGHPVLHLYDETVLLLSTYNQQTGREYKAVSFECRKSGAYTIAVTFKDGKPGEAIGILSYVNK